MYLESDRSYFLFPQLPRPEADVRMGHVKFRQKLGHWKNASSEYQKEDVGERSATWEWQTNDLKLCWSQPKPVGLRVSPWTGKSETCHEVGLSFSFSFSLTLSRGRRSLKKQ